MYRSLYTFLFILLCHLSFAQDNKYSTFTTYFRYDESSLNPKTYGKLNRYLSGLDKPEVIAIFITCYNDTTLSADASKLIADQRSNTLKGYLTAIGVPGDRIKNKYSTGRAKYPKNFTEEMETLYRPVQISVSYKVKKDFQKFDFSSYKLPKTKASYKDEYCSRDTTIVYGEGMEVTLSYCDYFNRKLNLEVNEYYNDQFSLFQNQLLKFVEPGMKPLSVHSFNFTDRLRKPIEVAIPISNCLSVGDYNLKSLGYDYNPSQIVQDKKSGYYKFKLTKPGTFVFQQKDYQEEEYDIEFIAKNGVTLYEVIVGYQCPRSMYRQKVEDDGKKLKVKLPYPNAEPQIFARGVNVEGDTLVMKFKPLNHLKSKKKLSHEEESLADNLNTRKFELYRKYYISRQDFDLMADAVNLLQ
ncbi:MAG: hypothetical protein MRY83_11105 [Flavobacteriales bacterium]|nr:hypothetical protein [Flavobacteriales bacterium]